MKTDDDFFRVKVHNLPKLSAAILPHFEEVGKDVPLLTADPVSWAGLLETLAALRVDAMLNMVNCFGCRGWVQLFVALDKNGLVAVRKLFVPDDEELAALRLRWYPAPVVNSQPDLSPQTSTPQGKPSPVANSQPVRAATKTEADFHKIRCDHLKEISQALFAKANQVAADVPLLRRNPLTLADIEATPVSRRVPELLNKVNAFGVRGWFQFFESLDRCGLQPTRRLFVDDTEMESLSNLLTQK